MIWRTSSFDKTGVLLFVALGTQVVVSQSWQSITRLAGVAECPLDQPKAWCSGFMCCDKWDKSTGHAFFQCSVEHVCWRLHGLHAWQTVFLLKASSVYSNVALQLNKNELCSCAYSASWESGFGRCDRRNFMAVRSFLCNGFSTSSTA